jgi:hypothetical protein
MNSKTDSLTADLCNRILAQSTFVNGRISFAGTSANKLHIDQKTFEEATSFLAQLDDLSQPLPDVATRGFLGIDLGDLIGKALKNVSPTTIKYLKLYWGRSGADKGKAVELAPNEWADVAAYAKDVVKGSYAQAPLVAFGSTKYYAVVVDFERSQEYNYAFGHATVYFDENGAPVGFYDVYDFNPANYRSASSEALTRLINRIDKLFQGKPYKIYHGDAVKSKI